MLVTEKGKSGTFESKLNNCLIVPRNSGEILFEVGEHGVRCSLDGYAIIPMEQYEALKEAEKYSEKENEDG
jgi:hypothetical protein